MLLAALMVAFQPVKIQDFWKEKSCLQFDDKLHFPGLKWFLSTGFRLKYFKLLLRYL